MLLLQLKPDIVRIDIRIVRKAVSTTAFRLCECCRPKSKLLELEKYFGEQRDLDIKLLNH